MLFVQTDSLVTDRSADELRTVYERRAVRSRVRSLSGDCISFRMLGHASSWNVTPVFKAEIRIKPLGSGQTELDFCLKPTFSFYLILGIVTLLLPRLIWHFVVWGTSPIPLAIVLSMAALNIAINKDHREFCMRELKRIAGRPLL